MIETSNFVRECTLDQYRFILLPAATKLGQGNIFTSVYLSTGGVWLSACWDTHPLGGRHPPDQAPPGPGTPPRTRHTHPQTRHTTPPGGRPPRPGTPPRTKHTPPWTRHTATTTPREADCSIRLTSGRYASYWNAFFVLNIISHASEDYIIMTLISAHRDCHIVIVIS